jgi:hypothetical protein
VTNSSTDIIELFDWAQGHAESVVELDHKSGTVQGVIGINTPNGRVIARGGDKVIKQEDGTFAVEHRTDA